MRRRQNCYERNGLLLLTEAARGLAKEETGTETTDNTWQYQVVEEDEEPAPTEIDCSVATLGNMSMRIIEKELTVESQKRIAEIKALPLKDQQGLMAKICAAWLGALRTRFTFKSVKGIRPEKALLDSGATENFIDIEFWKTLKIGRVKLGKSIPVSNVDGTTNKKGNIEYYCWLKATLGKC